MPAQPLSKSGPAGKEDALPAAIRRLSPTEHTLPPLIALGPVVTARSAANPSTNLMDFPRALRATHAHMQRARLTRLTT